jgi:hypothetical protein
MKNNSMKKIFISMLLKIVSPIINMFDTLNKGLAHAEEVAGDLESSVGIKPSIYFKWNNGSLTNVNITFNSVPLGSTQEIAALSRSSIRSRFEQQPEIIIISYTLPGKCDQSP